MILAYIIIFTLFGSVLSLIGGTLLLLKKRISENFACSLISFAAGALIGVAFLDLLPEAVEEAGESDVFLPALIGFVAFFFAERVIRIFHHHRHGDESGTKATTPLVIFGDCVHNFVDGVVITTAFLTAIPVGIITALAIAAHEVPQEIADMGVLLANGLSKLKALLFNFLSALTALAGALIAFFFAGFIQDYIYIFLALAAGHFIYISASDLIPELQETHSKERKIPLALIFVLGIASIWVFTNLFGHG
jgi:zinc and cadmium transporter